MFLGADGPTGSYHHRCEHCGLTRPRLAMTTLIVTADSLALPCPGTLPDGTPCNSVECTNHETTAHHARCLGHHPLSLVGTVLDGGNVVVEDSRYELPAHTAEQIRHQLVIHRHPLIAAARRAARAAASLSDPPELT